MAITQASRIQQSVRRLLARQVELQALLKPPTRSGAADGARAHEVLDFKDVAAGDSLAVIEEAVSEQALRELVQVVAALQRLRDGSYGICLDCGDGIAQQRLLAVPSSAYCASCQAIHEGAGLSWIARRVPGPAGPVPSGEVRRP